MSMDSWKGISIVSSYDIALYREHMAPLVVTPDTLDRGCTSLSEYLTTVPKGKARVDALLSSSKYLVLDLCLYLQDTLGLGVEKAEVYVGEDEYSGMTVCFLSHPKIEIGLQQPGWDTPSFYGLSVYIPGVIECRRSGYKLADGLLSLPDTIQRVLGMEACSTCTFSNDSNRYCGAGAEMYTANCTQREVKYLAPYIGDTTS